MVRTSGRREKCDFTAGSVVCRSSTQPAKRSRVAGADAAVFAANPNEYVVLFRDFQKQLQAGTTEIQGWNTQLKSIVDQATNMLTLSQLGGNPPAEHTQYIQTARGGIRDLLTKMEACDAFLKKRKAESAAASPMARH
jgi:hypothetical protein